MNHALLPSITNATLPVKYEAAKLALAQCDRIDECQDWADKSAALASYAKQSGDKTMVNTAMRIQARAIRRCGQLLGEFEKAQGKRTDQHPPELKAGAGPKSRKDAASDAGLSERQAKTALRVARLNGESFEAQVESAKPPTITALADQGKAQRVPDYVQLGMTIKAFQAGIYFRGALRRMAEETAKFDSRDVADGSTPEDRIKIRQNIETIGKYFDKLISKL